jgi:hypothetical protein
MKSLVFRFIKKIKFPFVKKIVIVFPFVKKIVIVFRFIKKIVPFIKKIVLLSLVSFNLITSEEVSGNRITSQESYQTRLSLMKEKFGEHELLTDLQKILNNYNKVSEKASEDLKNITKAKEMLQSIPEKIKQNGKEQMDQINKLEQQIQQKGISEKQRKEIENGNLKKKLLKELEEKNKQDIQEAGNSIKQNIQQATESIKQKFYQQEDPMLDSSKDTMEEDEIIDQNLVRDPIKEDSMVDQSKDSIAHPISNPIEPLKKVESVLEESSNQKKINSSELNQNISRYRNNFNNSTNYLNLKFIFLLGLGIISTPFAYKFIKNKQKLQQELNKIN